MEDKAGQEKVLTNLILDKAQKSPKKLINVDSRRLPVEKQCKEVRERIQGRDVRG